MDGPFDLVREGLGIVRFGRRHVDQNLRPIQALPVEGGVREFGPTIPAELVRLKELTAGTSHYLWQLARIPETGMTARQVNKVESCQKSVITPGGGLNLPRYTQSTNLPVGKPQVPTASAKVLQEPRLSDGELAHERLAAGQVCVHLNPGCADGEEALLLDGLDNLGKDCRILLAHPFEQLRLRLDVGQVRVLLEEAELGRECACALRGRRRERPQPA